MTSSNSVPSFNWSGLGLGLAIVQHIVEIGAHSTGCAQGSTFQIDLPLSVPVETAGSMFAQTIPEGWEIEGWGIGDGEWGIGDGVR